MSSQLQAFGSWRIILLNSDDLGDDGDVLTRVGANAAAFLPAGGGNPFDQDLNTDDAVVFAGLELNGTFEIPTNGIISTTGHMRIGSAFVISARNTADDANLQLLDFDGSNLTIGNSNSGLTSIRGAGMLISADAGPIDLFLDGDLNINGTPGVTNAAIVVDGVTLSFTKGILTGVA